MGVDIIDRPSKRARLLSDEEDLSDSGTESSSNEQTLQINDEFAKRFEHNKKREELQRLEEKYGKGAEQETDEDDESSDDVSEDSDAELATKELDAEIFDTLKALRSKDPRVYDKSYKFYKTPIDAAPPTENRAKEKTKPIHLRDYQRQNLLHSNGEAAENNDAEQQAPRPMTYVEEQDALKRDIVKQMHDANDEDEDDDDNGDGFLVKKLGQIAEPIAETPVDLDEATIAAANKDPEAYLDKFMHSRAWIPTESSRMQPFESDDDADDVADDFEHAYNMRFEDPQHANEKLLSHSRNTAKMYSVRRDELTGRQKARQRERDQKDALKRQRNEEKQRLRNLKLEAAQQKLQRFKEVAGLRGHGLTDEAWEKFMNADWNNDQWEQEMARQFDEEYYKAGDDAEGSDGEASKKPKKPKWDDDIDIGDIVPDFDEHEQHEASKYQLSNDEDDSDGGVKLDGDAMDVDAHVNIDIREDDVDSASTKKQKKNKKKEAEERKREQKRQARVEKMKLEELVEQQMGNDESLISGSKAGGGFRYRETSPGSYGLTAREILMADDTQLNSFVGLKKLATYRDEEKKAKDKKKLGKKDRLRKWRKETFGDSHGPQMSFQDFLASRMPADGRRANGVDAHDDDDSQAAHKSKKRRGGKKRKAPA